MKHPVLVIGGGLSGIAAAIRVARFSPDVVLLEKHSRLGGLNSYFFRNNSLLETGLHAITNYAEPGDKSAPLNRVLRQLKLKRNQLTFATQKKSKIVFKDRGCIHFSNDFSLMTHEIEQRFPEALDDFLSVVKYVKETDPFAPTPYRSAREYLKTRLKDPLLIDMLLCPIMYYGSAVEDDVDLNQFVILFRSIFLEGFFRPTGTIKDFLDLLISHLRQLGGTTRTRCGVRKIIKENSKVTGVELESGEIIECDYLLSTIGYNETLRLLTEQSTSEDEYHDRLGFFETIYQLTPGTPSAAQEESTIIFYNTLEKLSYRVPHNFIDDASGVICFPQNFSSLKKPDTVEIRTTNLANFSRWKELSSDKARYQMEKQNCARISRCTVEQFIGNFSSRISFENSFTPVTIERYTSKIQGAIYGRPAKVKDGDIGFSNLFLAGTDQGFFGIIGSMLSGVSIVNQHILPRL